MAANPVTGVVYNEYRYWEAYNLSAAPLVPSTNAAINASYLATPFALPPVVPRPVALPATALQLPIKIVEARLQGLEPPPPPPPPGATAIAIAQAVVARAARLAASLAPFPVDPPTGLGGPNWTGVKLLGGGGGGDVSLWEYTGPVAGRPPVHDRTVAKIQPNPGFGLFVEGDYLRDLNIGMSDHIVRLLVDPPPILTQASAAAQGLVLQWVGQVRRLILEYCPSGTLEDLHNMRQQRQRRLEELTLWKIFECLVDGCAMLEHGYEFITDILGAAQIPLNTIANQNPDPGVMVHFDLKPANVMCVRAVGNATHLNTPICKIGDLGHTVEMPRNGSGIRHGTTQFPLAWGTTNGLRKRGTLLYCAPEQFSTRWNHSGFATDPVCGKYGPATNVWGIGQIMYHLACYNRDQAEAYRPFYPGPLHALPPQGRAFGTDIDAVPLISAMLKDTIQECLYELPAHRPLLLNLKRTIRTEIGILQAAGVQPEGWQDLERLEPLTVAQAGLPRFELRGRQRCSALRTGVRRTPRCKNKVTARRNNLRPRCASHWDLRAFPLN